MEPLRVLQIVPNMHSAGLENWLMNIYRNIDRDKVQFDFLVHYTKRFDFDDEIEKLGGKIYRLSVREDNNVKKYINDLEYFFKSHREYRVIHSHMPSLAYIHLGIAKKNKIEYRFLHSHNAFSTRNIKGYIKAIMSKLAKYNATDLLACSEKAGQFQYGKTGFKIINNAIELEKFIYNEEIRTKLRSDLGLNDKFVIGHIGRFNVQKNHEFIIDIASSLDKLNEDFHLLLLGDGEKRKEIERLVIEKNIKQKVTFLGVRDDVNKFYQAFDVFILPSLHEGLPVVGVEAQSADLPVIFSNEITEEAKLIEKANFLPIDNGVSCWVSEILRVKSGNLNRRNKAIEITKKGYNVKNEARQLIDMYMKCYKS